MNYSFNKRTKLLVELACLPSSEETTDAIENNNLMENNQDTSLFDIASMDIVFDDATNNDLLPQEQSKMSEDIDAIINTNRAEGVFETTLFEDSSSSFEEQWKGRPKKGRKRKHPNQTREIRKKRKNSNKKYVSQTGKMMYPKQFRDYHCSCRCHEKISLERRKTIFKNFYELGDYNSQNMFLCGHVTEKPIKRKRVQESNRKKFTREYKFDNVVVCRTHFIHTLRVSTKRINTALNKIKCESVRDKRGQFGGYNKLDEEKVEEVKNHIRKIPSYKSHYCRSVTETKYLPTEMTLPLMYSLYKQEVNNPVSQSKYNSIFYKEFNLRRKPLKKDTCSKCDSFKAQLQSTTHEEEIKKISTDYETHLSLAEEARLKFLSDMKDAEKMI